MDALWKKNIGIFRYCVVRIQPGFVRGGGKDKNKRL